MHIVNLTYKAPLKSFNQNELSSLIAFGRKVPRSVGIILSIFIDKIKMEKIILKDPFNIYDVSEYELIEFLPSTACEELKFLIE